MTRAKSVENVRGSAMYSSRMSSDANNRWKGDWVSQKWEDFWRCSLANCWCSSVDHIAESERGHGDPMEAEEFA